MLGGGGGVSKYVHSEETCIKGGLCVGRGWGWGWRGFVMA